MKVLFVHQNCPAQFRHAAAALAADPRNEVVYLTNPGKPGLPGVKKLEHAPNRKVRDDTHPYLVSTEAAVLQGQSAARGAMALRQHGFMPDIIVAHPGWGESLFLKDVFPEVPLLSFCEFFYSPSGADFGFDPEFPATLDARCGLRMRNSQHLLAIEAADRGYSPTEWQRASFPEAYRAKIEVIHDGIDVAQARPDPAAIFPIPSGPVLRGRDPVVTYVARNLEPYRGFHSFMRALPDLFRRRPDARVVVVGGDGVSYGRSPTGAGNWREAMLKELSGAPVPWKQVHFLGPLPYDRYLDVLRVSSAHVYLTYPFVLSWSMLEAMASGCAVVGSATAPVEEVIRDGRNGRLVDFFDPADIARGLVETMEGGGAVADMRRAARETVLERYALDRCRARLVDVIDETAGRRQI